jgi:hypothetical protein
MYAINKAFIYIIKGFRYINKDYKYMFKGFVYRIDKEVPPFSCGCGRVFVSMRQFFIRHANKSRFLSKFAKKYALDNIA